MPSQLAEMKYDLVENLVNNQYVDKFPYFSSDLPDNRATPAHIAIKFAN